MAETILNKNQIPSFRHRICVVGEESENHQNAIMPGALPWSTAENLPFVMSFSFRTPTFYTLKNLDSYRQLGYLTAAHDRYKTGIVVALQRDTTDNTIKLLCGLSSEDVVYADIAEVTSAQNLDYYQWYTFRISFDLSKYTVEYKKEEDSSYTLISEINSSAHLYYTDSGSAMFIAGVGSSAGSYSFPYTLVDLLSFDITSGNTVYYRGESGYKSYVRIVNPDTINEFYEPQ